MSMLELAERCEAASGPDRDIDGWIHCAMNPVETTVIDHEPERFPRKPIYGPVSVIMDKIGGKDGADYLCAPAYTSSLDAAMSLLSDDWGYEQRRLAVGGNPRHRAQIWWVPDFPSKVDGAGRSPALALTAAALRARHALALSKGSEG